MKKEEKVKIINEMLEYYIREKMEAKLQIYPDIEEYDKAELEGLYDAIQDRIDDLKDEAKKLKLYLNFRDKNNAIQFSTDAKDIVGKDKVEDKDEDRKGINVAEEKDIHVNQMENLVNAKRGSPPVKKRLMMDVMSMISQFSETTTVEASNYLRQELNYSHPNTSDSYFENMVRSALNYATEEGYLRKMTEGNAHSFEKGEMFEDGLDSLGLFSHDDYNLRKNLKRGRDVLQNTLK